MAKYTGVLQHEKGFWYYRIKKTINGHKIDTTVKRDNEGNYFLTARAAYEAKIKHETLLVNGDIPTKPKNITLSYIYETYLNSSEAKQKAPSTIIKQKSMWKNHISIALGDEDINKIKITDLDNFLYEMYQKRSFGYTEGFLKFFYLLFGYAYKLELFDGDKYYRMFGDSKTRLTMPVKEQADVETEDEIVVYSDDELSLMEKCFKSEDGNLLTAYYLGVYLGVRISECFALRWSNINWKDGTITINRQLHNTNGKLTLSKVKTMTAIRTIIMPSFLHDYLDSYYQKQRMERITLGKHYKDTEKVYDEVSKEWLENTDFINRRSNGELLTVNSMKYWSRKIKQELNIDFKYHNLRHTYATQCAFNNVNMLLLMEMLGHKKLDTTKAYYLRIDVNKNKNKTLKLLNEMYDFHDRFVLDEPEKEYIETIDSKGRKTKYLKK